MAFLTGIGLSSPTIISDLFPSYTLLSPSSTATPSSSTAAPSSSTATPFSSSSSLIPTSSTDSQAPTNTQLSNALTKGSGNAFFQNKTLVIGVFAGAGAFVLLLLICLITCICRRRWARQRKLDSEMDASFQVTMAQAMDAWRSVPTPPQPTQGAQTHARTFSESSAASHGTFSQPPLAVLQQQPPNYDSGYPVPARTRSASSTYSASSGSRAVFTPPPPPPPLPPQQPPNYDSGYPVPLRTLSASSTYNASSGSRGVFTPPPPPPPLLPQQQPPAYSRAGVATDSDDLDANATLPVSLSIAVRGVVAEPHIVQPKRARVDRTRGHAHADSPLAQRPSQSADVLLHPHPQAESLPAVYLSHHYTVTPLTDRGLSASPLPMGAPEVAESPTDLPITPTPFPNPFDTQQEQQGPPRQLLTTGFPLSPLPVLPNPYGAD